MAHVPEIARAVSLEGASSGLWYAPLGTLLGVAQTAALSSPAGARPARRT